LIYFFLSDSDIKPGRGGQIIQQQWSSVEA